MKRLDLIDSFYNNKQMLIIIMTYLSLFCFGLTDNLRGTLFPEILSSYSLSNSLGAYIFILTSIFSIIASYASHRWLQNQSLINVWRNGLFLMGVGTLGYYLSPTFTFLMLSCAILGLGFGTLAVTQNLLITTVSSPEKKQRTLSGLHSMYGFASFLAPLLVRLTDQNQNSWKLLFLLSAALILLLYLSTFLIPKSPLPNPVIQNPPPSSIEKKTSHTLPISIIISCYISIELLISTRLTSYLKFHSQMSLSEASLYVTYFFIGLLTGRIGFTFFHPPISTKKMLLISLLGALLLVSMGLNINPIFLSLSGLLLAPFYPLAISLISEMFPNQVSSVLSKAISLQSLLFISMNIIVGYWTDFFGIASAMNAIYIFGGIAWFLLIKLEA